MKVRKFHNFRTAVTEPNYFFGRTEFLKEISRSPLGLKILLGGRKIGKTSALRAIEWSLLDPEFKGNTRAFPVLVDLHLHQPKDPDNFLYILISLLRQSIDRWKSIKESKLHETYRFYLKPITSGQVNLGPFLTLNVNNPDHERRLNHNDFKHILQKTIKELRDKFDFVGVCYLIDEAESMLKQQWGDAASSYIRGICDNDEELNPFLGFILSGYRDLKKYSQKDGSPLLNISSKYWLDALSESEAQQLIEFRTNEEGVPLTKSQAVKVIQLSGCHAFILQQLLNYIFDIYHKEQTISLDTLEEDSLFIHHLDFSKWWNSDNKSDGFGEEERYVYKTFMGNSRRCFKELENILDLTPNTIKSALQVLTGTGVLRQLDVKNYEINSLLFEAWVRQECI